jgi:hypothetical protein
VSPLVVVTLAREPETERGGIVLRTTDQALELVLMIPPAEAARLAQVLGLTPCACAPLYGLVEELLARQGATVDRAVLDGQPEGITARLVLARDGQAEEIGATPPTRSRSRCGATRLCWRPPPRWPTPARSARPRGRNRFGCGCHA